MDFKLIVTFGPAIQSEQILRQIDALGSCIYRINGAHASPAEVFVTTEFIKGCLPDAKVMVDLPGNKVRLRDLPYPMPISKGESFELRAEQFNYPEVHKHLELGDLVLTHDSTYSLTVKNLKDSTITFESHQDGTLLPNKGFHSRGLNRTLPFLFQRDQDLIEAAVHAKVDVLSLSFVRNAADIKQAKALIGDAVDRIEIFSKIETEQSIENLGEIFMEVQSVNIDRGDLSADIGVLRLPAVQERIIESARRAGREIYLATQFLKNMEEHPVPLISEVVDLYKTIKAGISGIQLSEETAVGRYPVKCVDMVFQMYKKSFSSA